MHVPSFGTPAIPVSHPESSRPGHHVEIGSPGFGNVVTCNARVSPAVGVTGVEVVYFFVLLPTSLMINSVVMARSTGRTIVVFCTSFSGIQCIGENILSW